MFTPKTKKLETTVPAAPTIVIAPEPVAESAPAVVRNDVRNVIGKGTIIQGNITAEGDLIIEGTVRGDVTTKTTLIIGPTCVIEGNILAEHAEVAGQVKGTVQALGMLVIKSTSKIDGDVLTKNLNVESGSTFNGRFTVGSVTNSAIPIKTDATIKADAIAQIGDFRRPVPGVTTIPSKI